MSPRVLRRAAEDATAVDDRRSASSRSVPCLFASAAFLAGWLLLPAPAAPQADDAPSVAFDGFGTAGLVWSSEDRADFAWNISRPDGPGHSTEVSAGVDSRLGGQLTLRVTPELSAVVQAVSEQDHEDRFAPSLEWAYIQYRITPELTVRAGRTPLPTFMVSQYRKVSYANPWIRPPVELYSLSPVFSGEGFEVTHRTRLGDWTNTVKISFGRAESEFPGGSAEATGTWNLNTTLRRGSFAARAAFATGLLDIDAFDPLFDGFRQFGPEGRAIAERFEVDETPFQFGTAGVEYDPGGWFAMAELGWADFNSALGERLAGYATGGWRVGPLTAFGTYSRAAELGETSVRGLPTAGFPPEPAQTVAGLNSALNAVLGAKVIQQNFALGGRWDFATGLALKAQVDFIDMLDSSPGTFINRQPGFEPGGSARVVSVATVFVF